MSCFQICKDKVEAEVWIAGLKALIISGQGGRSKIDGWSDGGLYLDVILLPNETLVNFHLILPPLPLFLPCTLS
jgi:hypothetical protein